MQNPEGTETPAYVLLKEIFQRDFLKEPILSKNEAQQVFNTFWDRITLVKSSELPQNLEAAEAFYFKNIRENEEYLCELLITKYDYQARKLEQRANV